MNSVPFSKLLERIRYGKPYFGFNMTLHHIGWGVGLSLKSDLQLSCLSCLGFTPPPVLPSTGPVVGRRVPLYLSACPPPAFILFALHVCWTPSILSLGSVWVNFTINPPALGKGQSWPYKRCEQRKEPWILEVIFLEENSTSRRILS